MRGAEEHGTRALQQVVLYRLATGDVATQGTDALGERAYLQGDTTIQSEMADGAAPILAQYTTRMSVIYHDERSKFFRQGNDLRQWCNVTIHTKDAICDNHHLGCINLPRLFQHPAQ